MKDRDDALAARVRAHNVEALAEYFVAHRPGLLAFVDRQLGPGLRRKLEVDDIFEELSVEALRALPMLWLAPLQQILGSNAMPRGSGAAW